MGKRFVVPPPPPRAKPPALPLAAALKLVEHKAGKRTQKLIATRNPRRSKNKLALEQVQPRPSGQASVLSLLRGSSSTQKAGQPSTLSQRDCLPLDSNSREQAAPKPEDKTAATVDSPTLYIQKLQANISVGRLDLRGDPWVMPKDATREALETNSKRKTMGQPLINSLEAWHLVIRPKVFVWAPQQLFPSIAFPCPMCGPVIDSSLHLSP
jgi:hypothetical protein